MNKIENNSPKFFNSNFPVIKGKLQFKNNEVYKVGQDNSNLFNKIIKLENESPLIVFPDDYVFEFLLSTDENEAPYFNKEFPSCLYFNKEFPSCLFTQARKSNNESNKIFFSQEEKNYELELPPNFSKELEKRQACTASTMYLTNQDIPKGYTLWGPFVDQSVQLSPKAKRIELGKPGCIPLNPEDLRFIDKGVDMRQVEAFRPDPNHNFYTVLLDMPGSLKDKGEDQYDRVFIDVIVDSGRLYVHAYPKKDFPSEKLYWINLSAGLKQIDEEAIVVIRQKNGILEIQLPLMPNVKLVKQERKPIEESEWFSEINHEQIEETLSSQTGKSNSTALQDEQIEEKPVSTVESNSTASGPKKDNAEMEILDDEPSNDKCCTKCIIQ